MTPTAAKPAAQVPSRVYLILLAGIAAVSLASIFIRFAQEANVPSLVIAAGRLVVAALVLAPFTLVRHRDEIARLSGRDWGLIGVSGLFLALHFATWVTSLEYTNVLISVVLVTSGPIWVALLEAGFLRARLGQGVLIGLLIAVAGGAIIGLPSANDGAQAAAPDNSTLIGALLALAGAITVSVYVVIGRTLRARVSVFTYIFLVYAAAALILMIAVLVTGTPVAGHPTMGYVWILVMGLAPQLIGHSSFNYALGYLPATLVSIAAQVEPIGSAVAAYLLFNEVPTVLQLIGSAVILVGVFTAILWRPGRT